MALDVIILNLIFKTGNSEKTDSHFCYYCDFVFRIILLVTEIIVLLIKFNLISWLYIFHNYCIYNLND